MNSISIFLSYFHTYENDVLSIPFRQVTIGIGHLWATSTRPAVHTDKLGRFEVYVEVPVDLPGGVVDLKVYAHYPVEVASIPLNVR